ncbi:hypothetical protein ACWF5H_09330 [Arthrobacter sp. NPDC055138]
MNQLVSHTLELVSAVFFPLVPFPPIVPSPFSNPEHLLSGFDKS